MTPLDEPLVAHQPHSGLHLQLAAFMLKSVLLTIRSFSEQVHAFTLNFSPKLH